MIDERHEEWVVNIRQNEADIGLPEDRNFSYTARDNFQNPTFKEGKSVPRKPEYNPITEEKLPQFTLVQQYPKKQYSEELKRFVPNNPREDVSAGRKSRGSRSPSPTVLEDLEDSITLRDQLLDAHKRTISSNLNKYGNERSSFPKPVVMNNIDYLNSIAGRVVAEWFELASFRMTDTQIEFHSKELAIDVGLFRRIHDWYAEEIGILERQLQSTSPLRSSLLDGKWALTSPSKRIGISDDRILSPRKTQSFLPKVINSSTIQTQFFSPVTLMNRKTDNSRTTLKESVRTPPHKLEYYPKSSAWTSQDNDHASTPNVSITANSRVSEILLPQNITLRQLALKARQAQAASTLQSISLSHALKEAHRQNKQKRNNISLLQKEREDSYEKIKHLQEQVDQKSKQIIKARLDKAKELAKRREAENLAKESLSEVNRLLKELEESKGDIIKVDRNMSSSKVVSKESELKNSRTKSSAISKVVNFNPFFNKEKSLDLISTQTLKEYSASHMSEANLLPKKGPITVAVLDRIGNYAQPIKMSKSQEDSDEVIKIQVEVEKYQRNYEFNSSFEKVFLNTDNILSLGKLGRSNPLREERKSSASPSNRSPQGAMYPPYSKLHN